MKTTHITAAVLVGSVLPLNLAQASEAGFRRADLLSYEVTGSAIVEAAMTQGTAPGETVTVAANEPIPNLPGKRLVSLIVDYAPGASSSAHRHAPSAFIYAFVLAGAVRSQVDDEPARVYETGEAWSEMPGAHHRVSENASDRERARLLAVFILDAADERLVISDSQ
jgi:quercetin dioxygenase-like cupin family protein